MAIITTLAGCNTNPALNGPDGSDLPSSLDDAVRYALSFIAQLRDGAAFPVGMIVPFATATAPAGWVKCNGASLSRATYAALWTFAGPNSTTETIWSTLGYAGMFSQGDGSTTFRVPDLRGAFLRGLDESRGFDVARNFGQYQADQNSIHSHGITDPGHAHSISDPGHAHSASTATDGSHQHSYSATAGTTGAAAAAGGTPVYGLSAGATDFAGAHTHVVAVAGAFTGINATNGAFAGISTTQNQGGDGRPKNYPFPFYMKY